MPSNLNLKKVSNKRIPTEIKEEVERIINTFNQNELHSIAASYSCSFKGRHVFIDRIDQRKRGHICRLEYGGNMNNWSFAIYKYSSNSYDENEFMFLGIEFCDGTILGALKAGMRAYP